MTIEELNEEFLRAVKNGEIEVAQEQLDLGADLNALTPRGNNALYVAATRKKRDMFNWLITKEHNGQKVNLDNRNSSGFTALLESVKEGDMTYYVTELLNNGANPNIPASDGMSPLIKAVADGKKEEIIILLNNPNTDVNYAIKETLTTAFLMATTASAGAENLEICNLLIDKGANINAADINGKNALINAIFRTQQFMKKAEKKDLQDLCKFLIEKNIDLDYVADSGMTAFWMASMQGNRELVNMMLERNVKTDVWHSVGLTGISSALHSWAPIMGKSENPEESKKDEEMISKIIALGANINAPGEDGNTPAIIGFANPFGRELTLKLGGDVNAILHQKDSKGNIVKTPAITVVIMSGDKQKDVVNEMISRGAKVSFQDDKDLKNKEPIVAAISSGALAIFESLLKTGKVDANLKFKSNEKSEELSLLSLLVTGKTNAEFTNIINQKDQLEALKKAKELNDKNGIVSPLIDEEGFKQIEQDLEKIKQLEKSLQEINKKMFDLLIDYKADVNLKNERGYTPLFFSNSVESSQWLIDAGADFFATADNDDDLLISAIKNNATVMLPFILEKFTIANHPSVKSLYYQLAFTDAKNAYQRELIESGIIGLLSPEEKEVLFFKPEPPDSQLPALPVVEPKKLKINHINFQDDDGNSPLLVACANDNAFLANLYTRLGADVNLKNNNGETPLMHAIGAGNSRLVEYLVKNNADVNAITVTNKSVLDFAEESENKAILEAIKIALGHGIVEGQVSGFKKLKM